MINKAKRVRMLILDVDGVMTDGGIVYSNKGDEFKTFNVKDGLGIRMLIQGEIKVVIISGRKSRAVDYRAEDLGIKDVYQGVKDKVSVFEEILKKDKITSEKVGFIGDDLVDFPLLSKVGFAVSVYDAVDEIKKNVDYVTKHSGGKGAIREVSDLILKAQGKWERCLSQITSPQ